MLELGDQATSSHLNDEARLISWGASPSAGSSRGRTISVSRWAGDCGSSPERLIVASRHHRR